MLKVYGRPNSSNSAKVFWLLDQIGQDYDLVPAGRGFGPTDTPEFLALNPFGKVPVVQDGDLAVWESNAVLRYLARRFDATALWPADAAGQSRIDRWMDWASISLTPPLTRLRKARAAGKGDDADLPAIVTGFALLDQHLARHDFIAGSCRWPTSPPRLRSIAGSCWTASGRRCRILKPMPGVWRAFPAMSATSRA